MKSAGDLGYNICSNQNMSKNNKIFFKLIAYH